MDLPLEEWRAHVHRRWRQLPPSAQTALGTSALREVLLHCSSLLQPEDEVFLKRLADGFSVEKDPDACLLYKEEGNKAFLKKAYQAATRLYSKGASHARPNTQEMSLCFANRSAAFFHLAQYETCLEDIGRAQRHGYPERLQPKLMLRKAECLMALGRRQEAALAIRDLEQSGAAQQASTGAPDLQALQRRLSHLKARVREDKGPTEAPPLGAAHASEEVGPRAKNERIPGASLSVSLCSDPSRGRYLIATEDVLPGELLVKEEAFVSVLNPGETAGLRCGPEIQQDGQVAPGDRHCHRCLKPIVATVPCQGCSYAKYCSEQCQQLAWEHYHRMECPLGGTLLTLGVFCHVALRTVLLAGLQAVSNLVKTVQGTVSSEAASVPDDQPPGQKLNTWADPAESNPRGGASGAPIPGCDRDGSYQSSYYTVFHLLPHTEKHSPEHKFLCGLSILALCRKLGDDDDWPPQAQGPSAQEAALATERTLGPSVWAEAMLRHVLQLHCNAQGVTALQEAGSEGDLVTECRQVRLATGLFPTISLLNHSCRPNTSLSFRGSVGFVYASRLIARGQEILHCYGPHEGRMDVATRQQKLRSQYFFDCHCQACQEEEAHGAGATPKQGGFRCPTCKATLQGLDPLGCSSRSCPAQVSRAHLLGQLGDLQQRVETAGELLRGDQTATRWLCHPQRPEPALSVGRPWRGWTAWLLQPGWQSCHDESIVSDMCGPLRHSLGSDPKASLTQLPRSVVVSQMGLGASRGQGGMLCGGGVRALDSGVKPQSSVGSVLPACSWWVTSREKEGESSPAAETPAPKLLPPLLLALEALAIQLLLACRREAEDFLTSEHVLMGEIEDHLAQAYASLGDWPRSAAHLRNSLQVVEAQHGPASVEIGHELFKLAQVLFNGFAVTEAVSVIEKAEKVLSLHFGPENEQVQELQQMKACLSEVPSLPVGPTA